MERQIPKNVRQIGNVSGSPKIYVEDYVDTFFAQLCEKAGETPTGAFLIGDTQKMEDEDYVYIYGAVKMNELKQSGTEYIIDEETWKHAYEDCKQYFEDGEMLGWFVTHPQMPVPDASIVKLHRKAFPKQNTIFVTKDPVEKEETYYVYKFNDLLETSGHYTYYEKNPCMQNYMISNRKKNGAAPTETVEDRAAKDFRSLVRSREERQRQKRANRAMYLMSACLVLLVVIMGVVTMNNFDKMQTVQNVLSTLSDTVVADNGNEENNEDGQAVENKTDGNKAEEKEEATEKKDQTETKKDENNIDSEDILETSGNVTAVIDEDGQAANNEMTEPPVTDDPSGDENKGDGSDADNNGMDSTQNYNGENGIYVVEEGDTLAMISQKMYGDTGHVDAISNMNGLTDGNLIYIGQKLLLP